MVTAFSCIASSKAACVLGGVRLILSAKIILEKEGEDKSFGQIMGAVMGKLRGKVSGEIVAAKVREMMNEK